MNEKLLKSLNWLLDFTRQAIWAAACIFLGIYAAQSDGYPIITADEAKNASIILIFIYIGLVVIIELVDWFHRKKQESANV